MTGSHDAALFEISCSISSGTSKNLGISLSKECLFCCAVSLFLLPETVNSLMRLFIIVEPFLC